jgi:hypothetical protein
MLHAYIDHLIVTAPSLAVGVEYVHDALGVAPQAGGDHLRMGTHNCLLKLGDALYLEVISVNPNAPKPDRPRWFQLDEVDLSITTRLAAWVARINDIQAAVAAAPIPLGAVEPMSRGQFQWLITIPEDGSLPFDGVAPMLIEWKTAIHPATTLPDMGCALVRIDGSHPQAAKITEFLQSIGFADAPALCSIQPGEWPSLVAQIRTPSGVHRLGAL